MNDGLQGEYVDLWPLKGYILVLFVFLAGCVGCVDGSGETAILPEADFDTFVSIVQPILSEKCANPSCHGNPDRPLEIYAVSQHRLDPAIVFLDVPLTDEEVKLNFHRACAFLADVDDPKECALVQKTLSETYGGARHGGGIIFENPTDPDYLEILAWIEDALLKEGETL